MTALEAYGKPGFLPGTESGRVGRLLGLNPKTPIDDIELADRIAKGLQVKSADALSAILGRASVVGPLVPEATLRRAKKNRTALSRQISERLYEMGRVLDAAGRSYHGDADAIARFMGQPHQLLSGRTPFEMAGSSSAGADAVINLLRRADSGFAL